jgi:two-component system C4-dicarboxylate transport sensor histidine kinase DctB
VHDINNALQVIGGSAELIGAQSELGPAGQRRIQAIATQTTRVSTTLARLTAFTQPGAAGHQVVDLAALVENAVALRAFTLNRAGIAVTVRRSPAEPCLASVDRRRILQVCLNVLLNAEAALADRPDATLQIRLERSGPDCCVSFTDNGPGISEEARARLVDAAAVPEIGPGLSGIGLWVSARIVEQHSGRLEVGETPGTGASLLLRLPATGP